MYKLLITLSVLLMVGCSYKPTIYQTLPANIKVEPVDTIIKKGNVYNVIKSANVKLNSKFDADITYGENMINMAIHHINPDYLICDQLKVVDRKSTYTVNPLYTSQFTSIRNNHADTHNITSKIDSMVKISFMPKSMNVTDVDIGIKYDITTLEQVYSTQKKGGLLKADRKHTIFNGDESGIVYINDNGLKCISSNKLEMKLLSIISNMKVYDYNTAEHAKSAPITVVPNIVINNNNGENSGTITNNTDSINDQKYQLGKKK